MLTLSKDDMTVLWNAAYKSLLMGTSYTAVGRAYGLLTSTGSWGSLETNVRDVATSSVRILAAGGLLKVVEKYTPLPDRIVVG